MTQGAAESGAHLGQTAVTVRNAPALYLSGQHLAVTVVATAQERVRRASIGLSTLGRYYPEAIASE